MSNSLTNANLDPSAAFKLTLFVAGVLHAMLILGLGFTALQPSVQEPPILDITWVQVPSASPPPPDTQRIATMDQRASGQADAPEHPVEPTPVAAEPTRNSLPADLPVPAPDIHLFDPSLLTANLLPSMPNALQAPDLAWEDTQLHREASPAEPTAAFNLPNLNTNRAPRTYFLSTLSARASPEAQYLADWVQKVERVGNLNYPDEARRRGLSGRLVLSVRLQATGQVLDISVTQSSGEPVLDQAALRIVELAQPFAPFTPEMRERYDELVITRTWAFRRDRLEPGR